jgi:hypothetical protein
MASAAGLYDAAIVSGLANAIPPRKVPHLTRRHAARLTLLTMLLAFTFLLALAGTAVAWDEHYAYPNNPPALGGAGHQPCQSCHGFKYSGTITAVECNYCHGMTGSGAGNGKGPHGGYLTTTDRCASCHTVHAATSGSYKLLPSSTVTSSCNSCHDGTGGHGVYGTIAARGVSAAASHSIDATNVIPGGNGATGGDRTQALVGAGGMLGCDDCHSPHDSNTVNPFPGDRQRTTVNWQEHSESSNKLLKKRPTGATADVADYGSDWCAACHSGRMSGGTVLNHPVDLVAQRADAFTYKSAAILSTDAPTGSTVMGPIGGWNRTPHTSFMHGNEPPDNYGMNRGYLMPFPRTAQQGTHKPICQQCHEDSRNAGTLSADGATGDAAPMVITSEDGSSTTDNPRFQNFPHETANAKMLLETNDDLCTNCHPPAVLP